MVRKKISWKSSQTGIYKRDVDSLVKNIYAQDFDKGYWVQTELEILTLPLPQKRKLENLGNKIKKRVFILSLEQLLINMQKVLVKDLKLGLKNKIMKRNLLFLCYDIVRLILGGIYGSKCFSRIIK